MLIVLLQEQVYHLFLVLLLRYLRAWQYVPSCLGSSSLLLLLASLQVLLE